MSKQEQNKEVKSNEFYTLSPTVLDEMIKYIERRELDIEWEYGHSRSIEKLKELKEMHDIYYTLMALKNGGQPK